jgi:hypothetical protein
MLTKLRPLPYAHRYVGHYESGCRQWAGDGGWICGGQRKDHPATVPVLLWNWLKLLIDPLIYRLTA